LGLGVGGLGVGGWGLGIRVGSKQMSTSKKKRENYYTNLVTPNLALSLSDETPITSPVV